MISTRSIALGLTLAAIGVAPATAVAKHGADDPATHATDDHGAIVAEPGDDNGGGSAVEPGDDRGGSAVEPGDDRGSSAAEPGDDKGGSRSGGSRSAKRVAGACTAGSSAKLKVKPRNGRLETEFEVDQNRSGVRWTVRIRRDG